MVDVLGIGEFSKIEGKSAPIDCKMSASGATMGWACNRIDCAIYGYCPFSL